jgi:hypothetical protein
MSTVKCLNCGGTVKPLADAKGNVGACTTCGQAEVVTKTRGEEIDKAIEAGEPSGGVAPMLTAEEVEAVRSLPAPEHPGSAPEAAGDTPTAPAASDTQE